MESEEEKGVGPSLPFGQNRKSSVAWSPVSRVLVGGRLSPKGGYGGRLSLAFRSPEVQLETWPLPSAPGNEKGLFSRKEATRGEVRPPGS